ncbi:MAG: c-type cytochrome [Porticoccaceae bacterium]
MTNRQARIFAVVATGLSILLFLGLTLDSHRQFATLTNAENITPQVKQGQDVWHKYNCINCHTLFGEGAYYAPDLTKITQHRGEAYLAAFMKDPGSFYDEKKHRRVMPNQNLSDDEITNLIAFLDWVSNVDNQGWPPRPILVTGGMVSSTATVAGADDAELGTRPVDSDDDIRALGEHVFFTATPGCNACHSLAPGADMAGPTMAGLTTRAEQVINSPDYQGDATDVEGYIRESIIAPSAHIVPGQMYSAGGTSFMPTGYDQSLTAEQIEQLTAFLATFK